MNRNEKITDEKLAFHIQQGDKEKFGFLMNRYNEKLLHYGRKFITDTYKIEDLVQDIFIKAYENIMNFDTTRKFSPWIYRIAHNVFINDMKKKKTVSFSIFDFDAILPHPGYEDFLPKETMDSNIKNLVEKGLENLSIRYKEILILYYMEDLSYKEIAEILKIPIGTVGIRLKRARDSLKKQIPSDILDK